MPTGPIPQRFDQILASTALAHCATVDERGRPEVNPLWFLWDGDRVLMSVREETRKCRNLRRDPHLALSILSLDDPAHYLELRGKIVEFELYLDLTFVNQLARKYTGDDFTGGHAGQRRYRLAMEVWSWTGQ